MDRILSELFGGPDPEAEATTRAEKTDKQADPEREARREARQHRKADAEARRNRKEFVERYTTGDPSEGFTSEEAVAHLREMRAEMTPGEFRRAMQRTLENLPPNQRDEFVTIMREYQAGAAGPAAGRAETAAAPERSATVSGAPASPTAPGGARPATTDRFGGLLTGLMGGGAAGAGSVGVGDIFDDLSKGGLRSPMATSGGKPTEEDFYALINSPLGRAVLGGVAAYGIQGMDEDDEHAPSSETSTHR